MKRVLFLLAGVLVASAAALSAHESDTNVALGKPVIASSSQKRFPASLVTDGVVSRQSSWISGEFARPPHMLDINLERYYDVGKVVIYTGIPEGERLEAEKGQAPGFWSMKNFKIQYWDDANWTDLPETECAENRLDRVEFSFRPVLTTFQLRLISTDGEPIRINEFEVYGKEKKNMPAPVFTEEVKPVGDPVHGESIDIRVTGDVVGKTMKYVAYNQGYYLPGSNVSGWLEYSGVNSLRVWASLGDYVPESAVDTASDMTALEMFEACKSELRGNPENNRFIRWEEILKRCRSEVVSTNTMLFEYVLGELKRLGVEPLLQINTRDFDGTWSNKWKQWQRFYALAFYAAKTGDVAMFAMQNEPNHRHSGPMKIPVYNEALKIVSDAVHCAVQDVNRIYGKRLNPRFVAPVTAGSNANWWAEVVKSIRIDYRGLPADRDLIDIFSTHSYNIPAAGYASKISDIRKIITDSHPLKLPLPIVYTETGRWMNAYLIDKYETMDSPSLFVEWAGEYTNNTLNQGYGMWAFKFANTASTTYPRGIKSGHHFIWKGKRYAEDAYANVALGKRVRDLSGGGSAVVKEVTDGDKRDVSTWVSADTQDDKCLEIDLGRSCTLGGAVVYTGSEYGVFTGPDRIRESAFSYFDGDKWVTIDETVETNCKYVQAFYEFKEPVTASKVRFTARDKGAVKVREIKLFDAASMENIPASTDVGGIHRTGEVVRLFAKGFKEERPLVGTVKSVDDREVDAITAFDSSQMRYYMWLVQRKRSSNPLTIDLSALGLPAGTRVIAEEVSANSYGEAVWIREPDANGKLAFDLKPQSVVLLTIPLRSNPVQELTAAADAWVKGGAAHARNFGTAKSLRVEMNAGDAGRNAVGYVKFNIRDVDIDNVNGAVLSLCGLTSDGSDVRYHVYALDGARWDEQTLTWDNAPNLHRDEVRVTGVGSSAHVAGEIVFSGEMAAHSLDVTPMVRKCRSGDITFVVIRELRHLGDDCDNGKWCSIASKESDNKPILTVW